jgi:eukaryotic-like serine/threonine-protein kinase
MVSPAEKSIFLNALGLATPEARRAYLDEACRGDEHLRAGVEALLAAHDRLGNPTPGTADTVTADPAAGSDVTTVSHPPAPEAGAVVADRYKLLEVIGEGGMGTVWLAEQTAPVRRKVAVKLVRPGMDSRQVVARFDAERQALALMDHSNIAKVLDGGITADDRPFFVMELVKGTPITKFCDDHRLPLRDRLDLFVQVFRAVQHAHQKGVIHRDIKPSNVLVAPYDGQPVPKVIDFGIAKAVGQPLTDKTLFTGFGAVVGTPEYMSPEQAELNNADIDTRSDVYSLGVLLYELLTGTTPLTHKRAKEAVLLEVLRLVREEEPPRPSTRLSTTDELPAIAARRNLEPKKLSGTVRGELDWIVMRSLEKDRNRRYETANAFALDVQRYLADDPVQACPPSAGYRLRKFYRRNRSEVVAAAVVAVALVLGLIGTTGGLIWADRERLDATQARDDKQAALDRLVVEEQRTRDALTAETRARQQAMSTLIRLTDRMVERQMARQSVLDAADKQFFESVIAEFDAVARLQGNGEQSRALRALGHFRVGVLTMHLGEHVRARRAFEEAGTLYRQLATDFPGQLEHLRGSAGCQQNLGILLEDLGMKSESLVEKRRAVESFKSLVAIAPKTVEYKSSLATAQQNLGLELARLGRWPEAEAEYRAALEAFTRLADECPDDPNYRNGAAMVRNNLGTLLADSGKPEEAEAEYRQSIDLRTKLVSQFPGVPKYCHGLALTRLNLGNRLIERNRPREAEAEYRLAVDLQEKLAADNPVVTEYSSALAGTHRKLAEHHHKQGNNPEAVKGFQRAIDLGRQLANLHPEVAKYRYDLAACHNLLGGLFYAQKKWKEAEEQYRLCLALRKRLVTDFDKDPAHKAALGTAFHNLGNVRIVVGKPEEALGWYQQAITLFTAVQQASPPKGARARLRDVYAAQARALTDLERVAEAIQAWDRAIELSEEAEREQYRWKRSGTGLLGPKQLDQGIAYYGKLLELEPNNAKVHANLGRAYLRKGRLNEAIASSRKALDLDPGISGPWHDVGDVLVARGEWVPALEAYEKAVKLSAGEATGELRSRRGKAYASIGVWDKALADLKAENPPDGTPGSYTSICCLHLLLGNEKGYRAYCQKAAEVLVKERDNPMDASRMAALLPDGPFAAALGVEWAEKAVAKGKSAWSLHVLGRAYYRVKQYDRAEQACRDSLKLKPDWSGRFLNWLLLAMAHERLGHADEARKWLATAEDWYDGLPRVGDPAHAGRPPNVTYLHDWLEFHVLLLEARRTVRPRDK